MIKGIIFDLDGVIYFDEEINHRLRGISHMESLEIILELTIIK